MTSPSLSPPSVKEPTQPVSRRSYASAPKCRSMVVSSGSSCAVAAAPIFQYGAARAMRPGSLQLLQALARVVLRQCAVLQDCDRRKVRRTVLNDPESELVANLRSARPGLA